MHAQENFFFFFSNIYHLNIKRCVSPSNPKRFRTYLVVKCLEYCQEFTLATQFALTHACTYNLFLTTYAIIIKVQKKVTF